MEEIPHQLIGSLSHHLQGFIHPGGCLGFLPSTVGAQISLQIFLFSFSPFFLFLELCRSFFVVKPRVYGLLFIFRRHDRTDGLDAVSCCRSKRTWMEFLALHVGKGFRVTQLNCQSFKVTKCNISVPFDFGSRVLFHMFFFHQDLPKWAISSRKIQIGKRLHTIYFHP